MNVRLIKATTQLIRIVCTLHAKAVARRRAELKAKLVQAVDQAERAAVHLQQCRLAKQQAGDALQSFEESLATPITLEVFVK